MRTLGILVILLLGPAWVGCERTEAPASATTTAATRAAALPATASAPATAPVWTVRLRFVPGKGPGGADWTQLSTPDKDGLSMAQAHVTKGGEFPVQDETGKTLFKIRMVRGDDDHVVLDVGEGDEKQRIDLPRGETSATVNAPTGGIYEILYPSVEVNATEENRKVPPTTDKLMLIVAHKHVAKAPK